MTEATNIELALAMYEAFNAEDIEQVIASMDPDVEWHEAEHLFDRGVYRGHDGIRRLFAENAEIFHDMRVDLEEVFECGVDKLIALGHFVGDISGVDIRIRFVHVGTLRDGKVKHLREYEDAGSVAKALETLRTSQP